MTGNDFSVDNYEDYPPVTKYANDFGMHTVSIVHWNPINDNIIQDHADFKLNVDSDEAVGTQAADYLGINDPDLMFLHFDDVDHAGHGSGFSPDNPAYVAAIAGVDVHVGTVLQALEARPNYDEEDWLILVTTDHGGIGFSHGGNTIEEQDVFVIASGNSVETEVILKDSTVTIDNPFNCLDEETELFFDNASVQVAPNPIFNFGENQDFTIECRVRTTQAADVAIVTNKDWDSGLNKGFVFSFRFASGPEWKVNIGDGSNRVDIDTGGEIADNEWTTLSVSFDRDGMMRMYEDGVFVDEADISGIGDIDTDAGLVFGADILGEYDYFGAIAEVRVWNAVVGEQAIADYSCAGIDLEHPSFDNLIGYWKMNEGSGTTVEDFSANNNVGTIIGAEWTTPDSAVVYDYSNTPRLVDVPVTALTHLCIPIEAEWDFDGTSLVEECVIDGIAGVDFSKKTIKVSPNPGTNEVQLVFEEINLKNGGDLFIYAANGGMVLTQKVYENAVNVEVSDFSDGLYWVILEVGEERFLGKLVKG